MKTPNEYYELIAKYTDNESLTAIWSELNTVVKELEEIKKLCRNKLEENLRNTGEAKVKTQTAVIGWTSPKPKLKLNQAKWQNATLNNADLYNLVKTFELKKAQVAEAQKDYLEETISKPSFYIR